MVLVSKNEKIRMSGMKDEKNPKQPARKNHFADQSDSCNLRAEDTGNLGMRYGI